MFILEFRIKVTSSTMLDFWLDSRLFVKFRKVRSKCTKTIIKKSLALFFSFFSFVNHFLSYYLRFINFQKKNCMTLTITAKNVVLSNYRVLKSNKKVISDFSIFFLSKWLSHINVTCQSQKKWKRLLNCSLCSPKTTYFAFFANICQLSMFVYTAIMKFFEIF